MTSQIKEFVIQTPDYEEEKIKSILQGVHSEYESIELERIEKPAHIRAWGTDD